MGERRNPKYKKKTNLKIFTVQLEFKTNRKNKYSQMDDLFSMPFFLHQVEQQQFQTFFLSDCVYSSNVIIHKNVGFPLKRSMNFTLLEIKYKKQFWIFTKPFEFEAKKKSVLDLVKLQNNIVFGCYLCTYEPQCYTSEKAKMAKQRDYKVYANP